MPCRAIAVLHLTLSLLSIQAAHARDCTSSSKTAMTTVQMSDAVKAEMCRAVAAMSTASEKFLTADHYEAVIATVGGLRRLGYPDSHVIPDVLRVASVRPPADLELLVKAYRASGGCVTPARVAEDINNAVRHGERGVAEPMYRGWDPDAFVKYLVMVGYAYGCGFREN